MLKISKTFESHMLSHAQFYVVNLYDRYNKEKCISDTSESRHNENNKSSK